MIHQIWGRATFVLSLSQVTCTGEVSLGTEEPLTCQLEEPSLAPNVTLLTFWDEASEDDAVAVLRDRVNALDGVFGQVTLTGRDALHAIISKRNPKSNELSDEIYQINGGSDVLQFALDEATTELCSLEPVFERWAIRERYFPAAWKPSECDGVPLALPLGVHRVNTVLLNVPLYERLQQIGSDVGFLVPDFEELADAQELLAVLEFAREQDLTNEVNERVIPLSLCVEAETWPLHHLAFESILASYDDRSYEALWEGSIALEESEKRTMVARMADDLRRFGAVSNIGTELRSSCPAASETKDPDWESAPMMVADGDALLTIGGDWMRGLIPDELLDSDIRTFTFPSQRKVFVYTPDSFALPPRRGSNGSSAHAWFRHVVDHVGTQVEFARVKQAIPARSDLAPEHLDGLGSDYLVDAYRSFEDCHLEGSSCELLLAVSGLAPASGTDPCGDSIGMLLGSIAGMEFSEEQWVLRQCPDGNPSAEHDAEELLARFMLRVSETPYASECRSSGASD